jgi:hypothetical protein
LTDYLTRFSVVRTVGKEVCNVWTLLGRPTIAFASKLCCLLHLG